MRQKKRKIVHVEPEHGSMYNASVRETALLDEQIADTTLDIKKIMEKCRDLRTQRNSKQMISNLPSELLLKVFLLLRSLSHGTVRYRGTVSCDECWDWVVVTWVCRGWRELGLHSASLWNVLYQIDNSKKAEIFIKRSRSLDLEVYYERDVPEGDSKTREIVRKHFPRVRVLRFKGISSMDACEELENWIRNPGPMSRLKDLCVEVSLYSCSGDLFENWAPTSQLERLKLDKVGFSWKHMHPILNNLQVLKLSDIYHEGPSIEQLLAVIKNCSGIRKLRIDNIRLRALASNEEIIGHKPLLIHLPHLHEFKLISREVTDRDNYFKLLEALQLGICDETNFGFVFSYSEDDLRRVSWNSEPLVFPLMPRTINTLVSKFDDNWELVILFYKNAADLRVYKSVALRRGSSQIKDVSPLSLYFTADFNKFAENSIKSLLQQDCIRNGPNLCLQFHLRRQEYWKPISTLKASFWIEIFETVPHLNRIEFLHGSQNFNEEDREFLDSFVSAFAEPRSTYIGSQSHHWIDLEEIVFAEINFSKAAVVTIFQKLSTHLQSRANNGKKMRKIQLASCKYVNRLDKLEPKLSETVEELSFDKLSSQDD